MTISTLLIVLALFYGTGAVIKYNDSDENKCPACVESFDD